MVRAPCCERIGLKKGPWTPEEDQTLINCIQKYGHSNWRALPKQAGLLRCGKSCRLRWVNYLRPDVKRGNFTREDEETILKLHRMLGNRWSAIAARLPGRTDNEIKNFWNTHLKKRLADHDLQNQTEQSVAETSATTDSPSSSFTMKENTELNHELVDEGLWSSDEEKFSDLTGFVGKDHDGAMGFWYDLFIRAGGLEGMELAQLIE